MQSIAPKIGCSAYTLLKWVQIQEVEAGTRPDTCRQCETLTQAPMPAQLIDKGMATSGLLAHVLVAKYADHGVLRTQLP